MPNITTLVSTADAVRVIFSDSDARGGAPRGWADLRRDGTFAAFSLFEPLPPGVRSLDGAVRCQSESSPPMGAFVASDDDGAAGVVVLVVDGPGFRALPPVFSAGVFGASGRLAATGCVVDGTAITVLVTRSGGASAVARWSWPDGLPLAPPITVGSSIDYSMIAADADGAIVLGFTNADSLVVRAYRLVDSESIEVAAASPDVLVGPLEAYPMGTFRQRTQSLILYNSADVLFLLPFSSGAGFGPSAVLTDAGCRSAPDKLVRTTTGTYLPCASGSDLTLLTMCRGGAG